MMLLWLFGGGLGTQTDSTKGILGILDGLGGEW